MEHRPNSKQTKESEINEQQTDKTLTYTKDSGTSGHSETSNQKIPISNETSYENLTYSVDSEIFTNKQFKPNKTSDSELMSVCACILSESDDLVEDTPTAERKRRILSTPRTVENYLRERRIPELLRFFVAKIMCNKPRRVETYIVGLLDECMLFRAGFGIAPVLFEERHLEAVIKSFDPGNRGWLSVGQVRRAFTTLGLTPKSYLEERTATSEVLNLLRKTQERELFVLLTAGCKEEESDI